MSQFWLVINDPIQLEMIVDTYEAVFITFSPSWEWQ